jgi:hypothetical protein
MDRIHWKFHLAWMLSLAATGCVVHTLPGSQQAPRHAAPPPAPREIVAVVPQVQAEDPRLAQCRRDNYQEHAQAMQIYHRAQQAGNISPDEARHFAAADERLRHYAAQLGRNGLTLGECEAIGRQIAEQQMLVRQMAASRPGYRPYQGDPALLQCRAEMRRVDAETNQLYHRARAAGEISPREERLYAEMEQRMTRHAQSAARDGLSLRECEFLLREANHEREQVERMASNRRGHEVPPASDRERGQPDRHATPNTSAPVPPVSATAPVPLAPRKFAHEVPAPLAQCSASNQKMREETRQQYARARAEGAITPFEQDAFEKTEQRLDHKTQELARDGLTLPECEALANELAEQRKRVERMAGAKSRVSTR